MIGRKQGVNVRIVSRVPLLEDTFRKSGTKDQVIQVPYSRISCCTNHRGEHGSVRG